NPASQIAGLTKSNDAYAYASRVNVNRGYTSNGLNQYTLAGGVSFGYDTRGNLTSSGSNSYTYSKLNELKSATVGGAGTTLHYDGLGRLVEYNTSTSTRMYYSGGNLIAEVANPSGAILRRFV